MPKIANNHNQIDTYNLTPYVNLIEYTDVDNKTTLLSNDHSQSLDLNKTRLRYRNPFNNFDSNGNRFDDWNHNGVNVNLVDHKGERDIKYVSSNDGRLDGKLLTDYLNYLDRFVDLNKEIFIYSSSIKSVLFTLLSNFDCSSVS